MKRGWLFLLSLLTCGCAQAPYHLKVSNTMADAHGQSIYFRSTLRSSYAGQIRRILSNKFAEIGLKTATSAENADYIAVFDIETFYKPCGDYKNTTLSNTNPHAVLFSADEDSEAMYFSGNANQRVDHDQTCFTLNIGKKGTSRVSYVSMFCAHQVAETENFMPYVLDVYGQYATYRSANVDIQCQSSADEKISCSPLHDRQQAFINSLWIENKIKD